MQVLSGMRGTCALMQPHHTPHWAAPRPGSPPSTAKMVPSNLFNFATDIVDWEKCSPDARNFLLVFMSSSIPNTRCMWVTNFLWGIHGRTWDAIGNPEEGSWPMVAMKGFEVKNKITSTKDTSIGKRRKKRKLGGRNAFAQHLQGCCRPRAAACNHPA